MKNVYRTCIVCKNKKDTSLLNRIVLDADNQIVCQKNKKLDGRGAYICKDSDCIEKLPKSRALNRVFKRNFENKTYEELTKKLKD